MQSAEPFAQPTSVRSREWGHVRDGANAEQIPGADDGIRFGQGSCKGAGDDIGESNASEASVGRVLGGESRMHNSQGPRRRVRDGVVVGDDHLHTKGRGFVESLSCSHPVIHRDQQLDAITMKFFHHPGIESVTVIHPAGDGGHGLGSQGIEGPD